MIFDFNIIHYKKSACLQFNKIIIIKVSFVFCSTIDLQKMLLGKLSFLHTLFLEKEEQPEKKIQNNVSQVKQSPHANTLLFLSTLKLVEKSRRSSCPRPFKHFQNKCGIFTNHLGKSLENSFLFKFCWVHRHCLCKKIF